MSLLLLSFCDWSFTKRLLLFSGNLMLKILAPVFHKIKFDFLLFDNLVILWCYYLVSKTTMNYYRPFSSVQIDTIYGLQLLANNIIHLYSNCFEKVQMNLWVLPSFVVLLFLFSAITTANKYFKTLKILWYTLFNGFWLVIIRFF